MRVYRKRRLKRWFERSLLLTGVLALDIWIWSQAVPALYEAWQEGTFDRNVQDQQESQQQQAASPEPRQPSPGPTAGPVGRLSIPRLHIRAMVREGDGEDTLSLTLGHIPSTAFPGQPGNVGVAGHRDTIFRGLRNIRKNDLIVFATRDAKYSYRVEKIQIVKPEQVGVLKAGATRELTLVTCYPFHYVGSAPDRFIVKARQVVGANERPHPRKGWGA